MILVIINAIKNHQGKVTIIILTVCCILQIIDLSANIKNINTRFAGKKDHISQLTSEAWVELTEHNKIIFMPINNGDASDVLNSDFDLTTIFDLGEYAINNNMLMSDFYVARSDIKEISRYRNNQWEKIKDGNANENAIYIFDNMPFNLLKDKKLNFYKINNLIVGCVDRLGEASGYEDVELLDANNQYSIKLENNKFLLNGEDTENGRILKTDGTSYGPYIPLECGTYRVTIQGENLDKANYDVCTGNGENIIQCNELYKDTNKIEYTFKVEKDVDDLEIRIMNNQEEDIIINEIKLGI